MSSQQLESPSPLQQLPFLTPTPPSAQVYSFNDHEHSDDDDIYRGERLSLARPSTPSTIKSSSSSTSSASSSLLTGGRLGALAFVVEQAITRWARSAKGESTSLRSSSSSSSSSSSIMTTSRSSLGRRRRHMSNASSLLTDSSEKDIASRITRMKALEESRQIPRLFILYLPPSLPFPGTPRRTLRNPEDDGDSERITHTRSLSLVLSQLDVALRRATKAQRPLHMRSPRHSRSLISTPLGHPRQQYPDKATRSSSSGPHPRRGRKGKARQGSGNDRRHIRFAETEVSKPWFLDVASPTWEDLRAIGKLLHIHPLTLEDILQRNPREKLEIFPKLGYYFISFRAIETREGKERSQWQLQKMTEHLEPISHLEGVIGETTVYLAIFTEGVCCFHYNDVAEHTDRIRNRLTLLEEVASMSSDWIAHGILDSIVDSFFPYLEEIGKEVMAIEDLVTPTGVDGATASSNPQPKAEVESLKVVSPRDSFEKKLHLPTLATETFSFSEKSLHVGGTTHPRFVAPQWTIPLAFRRVRRFLTRRWKRKPKNPETPPSVTTLTLRRIARARRLVTSLNRLLASKSEVITQIRKRLLNARTSGLGESSGAEGIEVAIYMGDVEDHILTLQHSLLHYEHLLSQSHPTYLTQLRTLGPAKNYNLLLYMSTVSVGIIPMSIIIAMCSLNLQLPSTPNSFYGFAAVIGIVTVIFIIHCCLVMYWWRQAKQAGKRRRS